MQVYSYKEAWSSWGFMQYPSFVVLCSVVNSVAVKTCKTSVTSNQVFKLNFLCLFFTASLCLTIKKFSGAT